MVSLNLTPEDRDTLIRILEEYFSELRMEISNTENWEFKKGLKVEEKVLNQVLAQLRQDSESKV